MQNAACSVGAAWPGRATARGCAELPEQPALEAASYASWATMSVHRFAIVTEPVILGDHRRFVHRLRHADRNAPSVRCMKSV